MPFNIEYDSQYRFKKLTKSSFSRLLRQYKNKSISEEQFIFNTSMLASAIPLLSDPIPKEFISLLNANIKHHRTFHNIQEKLKIMQQFILEKKSLPCKKWNTQIYIDWKNLPKYLIPEAMNMTLYKFIKEKKIEEAIRRIQHGKKKRLQIQHFLPIIDEFIKRRKITRIVDFAGGRGDFSLILAYLYPDIQITLVELKIQSVVQVKYRASQLKLSNMHTFQGDLRKYQESFDLAVGLHCCGMLTDWVLDICQRQKSDFLICTCCFGKIKQMGSQFDKQYFDICNQAECEVIPQNKNQESNTMFGLEEWTEQLKSGKWVDSPDFKKLDEFNQLVTYQAKLWVNSQRVEKMKDIYDCQIIELPKECSVKNQILCSQII